MMCFISKIDFEYRFFSPNLNKRIKENLSIEWVRMKKE